MAAAAYLQYYTDATFGTLITGRPIGGGEWPINGWPLNRGLTVSQLVVAKTAEPGGLGGFSYNVSTLFFLRENEATMI